MKFFLDTEFIEDGKTIDLVSLALVAENGAELYRESCEFDPAKASEWVKDNVLSKLSAAVGYTKEVIKTDVLAFIEAHKGLEKPVFWGYYADYDWVVFCQLFGSMIQLPKGYPMYCRDIKQLCDSLGNPDLPTIGKNEHSALSDARWNKRTFEFLISYRP